MSFNITSLMVGNQLPDHIEEDYPKFVEFLSAYYKFLETYNIDLESLKDIDASPDPLLYFLKQELAKRFPNSKIDERKFTRSVRELYSRKGTFDGIELLFRLFFNETITIREPSKQILRASDGKWQQDNFFTLETVSGSVDNPDLFLPGKTFFATNQYGIFNIEVEKIVKTTSTNVRIYYKGSRYLKLNLDEIVAIKDGEETVYTGSVISSTSKLRVVLPGKNWLVGQVFTVPNTSGSDGLDTIAKVTSVDSNGGIRTIEIYEHGYEHAKNQIIQASPYPNKPSSGTYDITRTLVSVNPEVYEYNLTINDYVEQVKEDVVGLSNIKDANSYFLEDYADSDYTGRQVIRISSTQSSPTTSLISDPSLTLEDWLDSQAYLSFEADIIVKGRGQFLDESGQVSNAQIRLQDNYYYQLFSYVLETTTGIDQYRSVLDLIHPAGLKYFGSLNKTAAIVYDQEMGVYRTLSNDTVYARDVVEADDNFAKSLDKVVDDQYASSDSITDKHVNKYPTTDSVSSDDGSGNVSYSENRFDSEGYFAESYGTVDKFINIGS